ncbi:pyrroline-5-carboxylate reductase dimerization domain-containing protein [Nitrincola sp. MINF-07-Sa-05]|uniref:pyrroline-5-carboxylate reductase dimerization domain-containing protein n=1 Tax=Nitrincola salilacus TaxID=3400273 RepID=UPI003918148C
MKKNGLGVIGVGELSGAFIRAMGSSEAVGNFYLSPRGLPITELSVGGHEKVRLQRLEKNQSVADQCQILLIGVRPGQLADLAAELTLTTSHHLLVLAAGVTHEQLETMFHPARVTRVMAGLAVAEGRSAISIYPKDEAAMSLLSPACATVVNFDDELSFDASILAVCANAWWLAQLEVMINWMQSETGMARDKARALLMANHADVSMLMSVNPDKTPAEIADRIGTPGTYTAQGMQELEQMGAHDGWCNVLSNILKKIKK